jgi:hypothetical protein
MYFPENTGLLIKDLRSSAEKHPHQRSVHCVGGPMEFNFGSGGKEI